jgi:hypothetical protein
VLREGFFLPASDPHFLLLPSGVLLYSKTMIRLLLLKFWPVLLPLGFYFLWMFIMSRRMGGRERIAEHIRKGLLFWAIISTVVLTIGAFIYWGVSQGDNSAETYVPATTVNGVVVPAHTDKAHELP